MRSHKKIPYICPAVEIIEISIEKGFSASPGFGETDNPGDDPPKDDYGYF